MSDTTFDFTPAFGGDNSVSAGTPYVNTGVVGPLPPSSGVSGGFSWTNTVNTLAGIAAPIATGLINANATKAANKAAAKQAAANAAAQAEYLRQQAAAAQAGTGTGYKMPSWLLPVAVVVLAVGGLVMLLRSPNSKAA